MRKLSIDFDQPWKQIFTYFFREAIAFISPELYKLIDWSRGIEFLEQELREIIKTRFHGAKLCDKLAKVWLKSGEELFLLMHVEIEANPKANFSFRFFHYRILIIDKHKSENIYSIAVYPGDPSPHQVSQHEFKLLDNQVLFKFPVLKIWEQEEEALMASENIFALFVLAQKYANQTKDDAEKRLRFRKKLFDLASQKNIPKRKIYEALIFVRELTTLPENLEIEYKEYAQKKLKIKSRPMVKMDDVLFFDSILEETTGKSLQKTFQKKVSKAEEKARLAQEQMKQAKQEARKALQVAMQAKKQMENSVRKCYRERKWTIEEIAEFFSLKKAEVEEILKKSK